MKAYEAWVRAELGQKIHRISRSDTVFGKWEGHLIDINKVFGVDFSADDWEVVKEKHHLTFTNVNLKGTIGGRSITDHLEEKCLERPLQFTKVHLEWEI